MIALYILGWLLIGIASAALAFSQTSHRRYLTSTDIFMGLIIVLAGLIGLVMAVGAVVLVKLDSMAPIKNPFYKE